MSHDSRKDFEMSKDFNEREFAGLAQALREHRPAPEPEFTDRLDQAVADHFPPEWADEAAMGKPGTGGIGSLTERFRRRMGGRRILLPAMAGFAGLLVVATVAVGVVDSGRFAPGGDGGDESGPVVTSMGNESMLEGAPGVSGASKLAKPKSDEVLRQSASDASAPVVRKSGEGDGRLYSDVGSAP